MPSRSPSPAAARAAAQAVRIWKKRPRLGLHGMLSDYVGNKNYYHVGNGVRSYDPIIQRVLQPDPLSPFGTGGINPYAFCLGDPVNNRDPSGYSAISNTGIALGLVSLVLSIATFGTASILASLGLALAIISVATGAASNLLAGSSPGQAATLGRVSYGLGVAASLVSLVLGAIGFGAWRLGRHLRKNPDFDMSLRVWNKGPGVQTVGIHGSPHVTIAANKLLRAPQLARRIRPLLDADTDTVLLGSCHAGQGNSMSSVAQVVANRLGKTVVAGKGTVSPEYLWKTFTLHKLPYEDVRVFQAQGMWTSARTSLVNTVRFEQQSAAIYLRQLYARH